MPAVAFDRVEKVFPPSTWALRDFSLTVHDGELLVLVGPSGCGKTTALRIVAGLDQPTAGTVSIAGSVVNDEPPRNRDVAFLFQRPAVYPHLSVRHNLEFGQRLRYGWARGRTSPERLLEVAQHLGLDGVLDRRATDLSGGQQQRVALGRALVRRPSLFLLDEPLSQLDAPLRADLRRQLHLLQRQFRVTMLYVTHDPAEAMALADRVAVLDRGAVQQVGEPRAVYDRPANRMVAGFFGSPSMNLVDGVLVSTTGLLHFQTDEGSWPLSTAETLPLRSWEGRPITLGIRPEALRFGAGGLAMETIRVEPWGPQALVSLQRGKMAVTALLDRSCTIRVREGETVDVVLTLEHTHWYDRTTGQALWHGDQPASEQHIRAASEAIHPAT